MWVWMTPYENGRGSRPWDAAQHRGGISMGEGCCRRPAFCTGRMPVLCTHMALWRRGLQLWPTLVLFCERVACPRTARCPRGTPGALAAWHTWCLGSVAHLVPCRYPLPVPAALPHARAPPWSARWAAASQRTAPASATCAQALPSPAATRGTRRQQQQQQQREHDEW